MKKVIKLTESDLARIVRQTLNENVNQTAEDFRSESRRLLSALDDYSTQSKRGESREIEETKGVLNRHIRRVENIIDELKRKLR